eukprot:56633_1
MLQSGCNVARKKSKCRRPGCIRGDIVKSQRRCFIIRPPSLTGKSYPITHYYHTECKPTIIGTTLHFPEINADDHDPLISNEAPIQPSVQHQSARQAMNVQYIDENKSNGVRGSLISNHAPIQESVQESVQHQSAIQAINVHHIDENKSNNVRSPLMANHAPNQQPVQHESPTQSMNVQHTDDESSSSDWTRSFNFYSKSAKLRIVGITQSEWDEFTELVQCDAPEDGYKMDWYLDNLLYEQIYFDKMDSFTKITEFVNDFGRRWAISGAEIDEIYGRNVRNRTVCVYHENESAYTCTKCVCYASNEDMQRYKRYVRKGCELENERRWGAALDMFMNALEICNQDDTIQTKCMDIADKIGYYDKMTPVQHESPNWIL